MQLGQLENLYNVLKKLQDIKMSARIAYKFMKIMTAIEADYQFLTSELRKIIDEYAERDDKNQVIVKDNGISIKKEFLEKVEKEIQALYETEIELPNISFTLKELELVEMTPLDFQALESFITE